jgi:3-methylcrotonyl-CoA carboxylase alpha subunit
VEWQIRVAAGERLPLSQEELTISGHSFEARIYAEDPLAGFRPGSGPLLYVSTYTATYWTSVLDVRCGVRLVHCSCILMWCDRSRLLAPSRTPLANCVSIRYMDPPTASPHIRVDSGVKQGDSVSVYYDPMIAKLVVWGENRRVALARMTAALKDFHIAGLATNIEFVGDITTTPAFQNGDVSTAFIEENEGALLSPRTLDSDEVVRVAVAVVLSESNDMRSERSREADPASPWSGLTSGYLNMAASRVVRFEVGEVGHEAAVRVVGDGTFEVDIDGDVVNAMGSIDGNKYTPIPPTN